MTLFGDGEVFGEMDAGPSSAAAMEVAAVAEGGGELRVTLLGDGEVIGEIDAGPSSAAAMAVAASAEGGGELRVILLGEGSQGEEMGERDFLFRETVLLFIMLQFSSEKTATVAVVAVADGWWQTAEQL